MMRCAQNIIVTLFAVLLIGGPAFAQQPATTEPATQPAATEGRTIRLLTVGNSFAYNSTRYLRDLAKANGNTVILGWANSNGASLEKHWQYAEAFEADPTDPNGLLYTNGPNKPKSSLRQMLERDKWDYVTIQQASPLSDNEETYYPFAIQLHDYIKKHAPQAEVLIHQTWAYRFDHPRFKDGKSNPQKMHEAIRRNYHNLADRLDLRIVPVGDAMYTAVTDPSRTYQPDSTFNFANPAYPLVPIEVHTLHAGWRWAKRLDGTYRFVLDGFHANVQGSYLGACVFYEFLFGQSPVGNTFVPAKVEAADAAFLQQVAHDTMRNAGATTQPVTAQ
ncbi:MAG TPA: DUF4886 domain-containing protein [Tepidisphaeraceae bacterium]|jgi:lysophospholipase L1-like esterase|nr:DUF4886 domain-containing protein [Tepidisphaeraceae bacterium]